MEIWRDKQVHQTQGFFSRCVFCLETASGKIKKLFLKRDWKWSPTHWRWTRTRAHTHAPGSERLRRTARWFQTLRAKSMRDRSRTWLLACSSQPLVSFHTRRKEHKAEPNGSVWKRTSKYLRRLLFCHFIMKWLFKKWNCVKSQSKTVGFPVSAFKIKAWSTATEQDAS